MSDEKNFHFGPPWEQVPIDELMPEPIERQLYVYELIVPDRNNRTAREVKLAIGRDPEYQKYRPEAHFLTSIDEHIHEKQMHVFHLSVCLCAICIKHRKTPRGAAGLSSERPL